MLSTPLERQLAKFVAARVHAEKFREAANAICETGKIDYRVEDDDPAKSIPVLQNYLHVLLNTGGMEEAAQLLWTPTQFTPGPQSVQDIWNLFDTSSMGLLMGGASMGKSYSMGVRLFLEWIRDPSYTTIKLIGPSEDHLEQNLFSHMVGLHQKATLPMPGETGDLFIGLDRRNQVSCIRGLIIPIGKKKKAGRIQGAKCVPRQKPHAVFGPLSRMFIFIDEIENVPGGVWSDIDNVLSTVNKSDPNQGMKIFGGYNPTNQTDEVGKRAEPPFGWGDFDIDKHFRWKSVRGWDVLRLDGEKSENVVQGKIIYPGLQTRDGLEAIAKNSGGRTSPGYFSMGRGCYPPSGVELVVIPPGMIPKWRGDYIWADSPKPCAGADLALEGGAHCVVTLGKVGLATGMKLPPSLEHPLGRVVMFKGKGGEVVPKYGIQAESQHILPKGDTVQMKDELVKLFKRAGLRGEYVAVDRTGHGQGVADLIKYEWSPSIIAINYSEGSSPTKLFIEDTQTCAEEYDRIHTELWFAMKRLGEYGNFLISPQIDLSVMVQQLTQRKFRGGKKVRVESKQDFISRGFSSPDESDSLTLLVHGGRKGAGAVFSMSGDYIESDGAEWPDPNNGVFIDSASRTDYLDKPGFGEDFSIL